LVVVLATATISSVLRVQAGKYVINVIKERCKECGLCISICSLKVLDKGSERNKRGYRYVVPVSPEKCTGCRLCEYTCPDFAIFVERCEK
jgi:2-oxoglutarate ferredoxin oxidoreductase subunit delta